MLTAPWGDGLGWTPASTRTVQQLMQKEGNILEKTSDPQEGVRTGAILSGW